jgi:ribose-phosphate pyrophosphokinase
MSTHAILPPPAADRIKNAPLEEVVVTNTLPVPEDAASLPNLTILSIAPLLADTLKAIFMDTSVSQIFMGENV